MIPTHNLKWYRKKAELSQQDVATLLNITPQTLNRYENGSRDPTLEVTIAYHILFSVPIHELYAPQYKEMKHKLVQRGKILIKKLNQTLSPKRSHIMTYLTAIVNNLNEEQRHESTK